MSSSDKVNTSNSVSIEDDMDDDFDDLLDKFNHSSSKTSNNKSNTNEDQSSKTPSDKSRKLEEGAEAGKGSKPEPKKTDDDSKEDENGLSDEFIRDLAEGMEALLAGMNNSDNGEFKKHLEALSKNGQLGETGEIDGLLAAALNQAGEHNQPSSSSSPSPNFNSNQQPKNSNQESSQPKNFQDAIQDTIEKLKQSEDSASKGAAGSSGIGHEDEQLASLLEKMMSGEGGLADEGELQTILQSFMEELMSKEIMYEPMKDMNRLYPDWISNNQSKLSSEDLSRYRAQSEIVAEVVKKFDDPAWDADAKEDGEKFTSRRKEVIDLLTKMQDCGPPPKEIMGDVPPGLLGEDGMPNPEQCNPS